jgi:hypothetical protein
LYWLSLALWSGFPLSPCGLSLLFRTFGLMCVFPFKTLPISKLVQNFLPSLTKKTNFKLQAVCMKMISFLYIFFLSFLSYLINTFLLVPGFKTLVKLINAHCFTHFWLKRLSQWKDRELIPWNDSRHAKRDAVYLYITIQNNV